MPSGWRNDATWPGYLTLSRPDTPGASLQLLSNAHAARLTRCTAEAVGGPHDAAHLSAMLTRVPGLVTGGPRSSRIGERRGYAVDLTAAAGAGGVACPNGLAGTLLLTDPPDDTGDAWVVTLRPGQSARIVLANGSRGRTLALVATVRGEATALQAWIAKAQPVIDSITFAPCTFTHTAFRPCEDLRTTSP